MIAIGSAWMMLAGPAIADPSELPDPKSRITLAGKTLLGESKPESTTLDWFRANIRTVKYHGFEYSRELPLSNREQKLIFSIQGPMIKKKTPGLSIEIRF